MFTLFATWGRVDDFKEPGGVGGIAGGISRAEVFEGHTAADDGGGFAGEVDGVPLVVPLL